MDDVGRSWYGVIICAVILLMMFFFGTCENAVIEISDTKAKQLSDEHKRGRHLKKILERPNRLVMTNNISRSVLVMSLAITSTVYFYKPIRDAFLALFGVNDQIKFLYTLICILAVVIIIFVFSVLITTIGINLPKRLCSGGKISDNFILNTCGVYKCYLYIFLPLEKLSSAVTTGLMKLFGVKNAQTHDSVTEEEILMMVDAVNETGGIEESQAEMISNIFEFDDLEVRDVMTHRTDVIGVEINSPVREAVEIAINEGFSRIPVYEKTIDDICGVVFAKDLLRLALEDRNKEYHIKDFMRDIKYVPESNTCGELFEYFTSQKNHIAVAVDEYGGTAGIVTMEDLVEAIVGNIQDEYDNEAEEIQEITPNTFDILGNAHADDVMQRLNKQLDKNKDYDTIGGFVIDLLGYIPDDGETPSVKWENIEFSVIKAEDKHIEKLRAVIKNDKPKEQQTTEG